MNSKKVQRPRVAYCWGRDHTMWSPAQRKWVPVVAVKRDANGVAIAVRHTDDGPWEEVR